MRLAYAFFVRDARIAFSYKVAFFTQFLGNILLLGLLYFVGKTIGPQSLPALERYGGNYLAFLLIGVALTDCVAVSLIGFAQQVREAQTTGTLEATLMSPVRLPLILIYSSLWNYFLSAIRFLLYLVVGSLMYSLDLTRANLVSALVIFVLTVLSFMGVGMLWAGVVLLVRRGESILSLALTIILVLSGVIFPVSVLPSWIQTIAAMIPLTAALDGMRYAVVNGATLRELSTTVWTMSIFAVSFTTAGVVGFHFAVRLGRRNGSLTQY